MKPLCSPLAILGIITAVILLVVAAVLYRYRHLLVVLLERLRSEKISIPSYSVKEIEGFLTPEECDHIISISRERLEPSMVYSQTSDLHDTSWRKSDQAWLKNGDDPVVASISRRVAAHCKLPLENQEDLQVVSYKPGGFFRPHYDACDGSAEYCRRMNGSAGNRYLTYLIYLNDDFTGGETAFPKLGKAVKPKKGKCVVFQNSVAHPYDMVILEAIHGGNPVKSGTKWICNKWVRFNSYTADMY